MFFLGLALIRTDVSYESTKRIVYKELTDTTFANLKWAPSKAHDYGNGAALDVWNNSVTVTCAYCLFQGVKNIRDNQKEKGMRAGVVHCAAGTMIFTECIFSRCTANMRGGGILNFGGEMEIACHVSDCLLEDCVAYAGGAMICMPGETESIFNVTQSIFSNCNVEYYRSLFGAFIFCRSLTQFDFSHNIINWTDAEAGNRHTDCLFDLGFNNPESADVVIANTVITNLDVPLGIVVMNETKSLAFNEVTFENVKCGNATLVGAFLPDTFETTKVEMLECSFTSCETNRGFLDVRATGALTLSVSDCTFSRCKANSTAFFDFSGCSKLTLKQCHFGNVWFASEDDQLFLVRVDECTQSDILETTFDLTQISIYDMALSFCNGNFNFNKCTFVINGREGNSEIRLDTCPKVDVETCIFSVARFNASSTVATSMVQYKGVGSSTLRFYNCCFTHSTNDLEGANSAMYLSLTGSSTVTFESACFDMTKEDEAIYLAPGIKVTYDNREHMFGNCECDVFLPVDTFESLLPDPDTPAPTKPDDAKKVDVGLITGTFFGILLLLILLILLILFLLWRRKKNQVKSSTEPPIDDNPEETISVTETEPGFDGATNDNPLFAAELATNDIFANEFEENRDFLA